MLLSCLLRNKWHECSVGQGEVSDLSLYLFVLLINETKCSSAPSFKEKKKKNL